jgi:hypothetical protein
MVVSSNLQTYTYEEPFEVVQAAYQQRYPTHPRIPILLGITVQVGPCSRHYFFFFFFFLLSSALTVKDQNAIIPHDAVFDGIFSGGILYSNRR